MGASTMQYNVNRYRQVEAETNDPLKLVVMLFEGAINFLEQAKLRHTEGNVKEKGILLSKVIAILGELQSSLNVKEGGEFAFNMDRLYTYMMSRLFEANSDNNLKGMEEVLNHLRTYKDAWDKARATPQQPAAATPAATVQLSQPAARSYPMAAPMPAPMPAPAPTTNNGDDEQTRPAIEIMG
jgi:flagellar protein FliS